MAKPELRPENEAKLTRFDLDRLHPEQWIDWLFLGSGYHSRDDGAQNEIVATIDDVSQTFGVSADDWPKYLTEYYNHLHESRHTLSDKDRQQIARQRAGITLGRYVADKAWEALPIEEGAESDAGGISVTLQTPVGRELRFDSSGNFWLFRSPYNAGGDTDIGWSIEYQAFIGPVATADQSSL